MFDCVRVWRGQEKGKKKKKARVRDNVKDLCVCVCVYAVLILRPAGHGTSPKDVFIVMVKCLSP